MSKKFTTTIQATFKIEIPVDVVIEIEANDEDEVAAILNDAMEGDLTLAEIRKLATFSVDHDQVMDWLEENEIDAEDLNSLYMDDYNEDEIEASEEETSPVF